MTGLPEPLRLALSVVGLATSLGAKEYRESADKLKSKLDRLIASQEELERAEEALEFATQKVSLEESYGLVQSEPQIEPAKPISEPSQKFDFTEAWDISDDYGLTALAPDAKEAIRGWLTPDWALKNKVICAASGAGKSTYLRWEYRKTSAEVNTILIDPHLQGNHLEGVYWTGSRESDLRLVANTPYQIQTVLETWVLEIKERLAGNRELTPSHLIIDEADGYVFKEPAIASAFRELVILVANESRKTRVTLTFVVHSIQKQKTGLDAADLVQMAWQIMGNSLDTPNSRWPGGLNAREWEGKRRMLQDSLDKDQARALVVYDGDGIRLEVLEK